MYSPYTTGNPWRYPSLLRIKTVAFSPFSSAILLLPSLKTIKPFSSPHSRVDRAIGVVPCFALQYDLGLGTFIQWHGKSASLLHVSYLGTAVFSASNSLRSQQLSGNLIRDQLRYIVSAWRLGGLRRTRLDIWGVDEGKCSTGKLTGKHLMQECSTEQDQRYPLLSTLFAFGSISENFQFKLTASLYSRILWLNASDIKTLLRIPFRTHLTPVFVGCCFTLGKWYV